MVAAGLLVVLATGCAPLQRSSGDDYYEPDPRVSSTPSRIWVEDPYRPGASILMERDPFSGRYYPVSGAYDTYGTYGSVYPPYGRYNTYPSRGGYRRDRYPVNRGGYRHTEPAPQQREQISQQNEQRRQSAADRILGKKH